MDRLSVLDGWTRSHVADGVRLVDPDGARSIRLWPRHPLVPPRSLVRDVGAAVFGASTHLDHEAIARVVTDEGELALVASATARSSPRGCSVSLCGDQPCLRIDVVGADHRALAMTLARSLGLGLGRDRRRWYPYEPPRGWYGVRRGASTLWLHPHYPRVPAQITMLDARRFVIGATTRLDRWLHARPDARPAPVEHDVREDLDSVRGLRGRARTLHGAATSASAVALADTRYLYLAHFTGPGTELSTFRSVVSSVDPVPSGGTLAQAATYQD